MTAIEFDRAFDAIPGEAEPVSALVRRVLCDNPGPFTFRGTSSFIIGRGQVAVIDPGPEDEAHLAALLDAVRGETVSHILVTHTHADHSPLAARLKAATGAEIYGFGKVERPQDDTVRVDASVDHGFKPDVVLSHGSRIEGRGWSLEAVHTPGHMSNHLCFALAEEKALFAGDHVMAWSTSVVAPPDGNMGQYMASLRALLGRDDRIYWPAHGPARQDPLPLVRAYIAHRTMREQAIIQRLKAGDRTVSDIVRAIYADIDPRLHGAAALSTRAHLDHLVEQGRVQRRDDVYEIAGKR
jgi:glyoxylase-like metal-dependent hydrolase (beta-lactamase superfamily II)